MVARLKKRGTPISALVRQAIRSAYQRQVAAGASRKPGSEIMAEIYQKYPDPPELQSRKRNLLDRRTVRRVIRQRLRRPRS